MRLLAFIGALAIIVAIGAAVFFFGGFYSVAGTAAEPEIVKWALIQVRKASIARHATEQQPTPFDEPMVIAGARAYMARGCANCHGAPGVDWAKFSEGLRPDPPDLKDLVNKISATHLFWVVKNGINMTGMPSFELAGVPDSEIWMIVAFLKKLPGVSEADFKSWASMPALQPPSPPMDASPAPPPAATAVPAPELTPTPAPPPVPDASPARPN